LRAKEEEERHKGLLTHKKGKKGIQFISYIPSCGKKLTSRYIKEYLH
jgi:hypothetical protein